MNTAQIAKPETFEDKAGNLYRPHPAINSLWVADAEQRMDFLPAYFTKAFMVFEFAATNIARDTIGGYNGGYWEFALTDKGYPFIYPAYQSSNRSDDFGQRRTVSNIFQDEYQDLHPVLAGVITTCCTLVAMMQKADEIKLTDQEEEWLYDLRMHLRDYALDVSKELGDNQASAFYKLFN